MTPTKIALIHCNGMAWLVNPVANCLSWNGAPFWSLAPSSGYSDDSNERRRLRSFAPLSKWTFLHSPSPPRIASAAQLGS